MSRIKIKSINKGNIPWLEARFTDQDCMAEPSLILTFDSLSPNLNPKPIFFLVNFQEPYPYYPCGELRTSLPPEKFCCYSSLSLDKQSESVYGTEGWKSGTNIQLMKASDLSPSDLGSIVPRTNSKYCELTAKVSTSLFGISMLLVREEFTNPCILLQSGVYFTCFQKILTLFSDANCITKVDSFDTSTGSSFPNSTLGFVNANYISLDSQSKTAGWITYQPPFFLIPLFKNGMEVVCLICFILSLSLFGGLLMYSINGYLQSKRSIFLQVIGISISWIVAISFSIYFTYTTFEIGSNINRINLMLVMTQGIAQLLTTAYTVQEFIRIVKPTTLVKYLVIISVFLIHLILKIGEYLSSIMNYYKLEHPESGQEIEKLLLSGPIWDLALLSPGWIAVMFIFNIVPLNYAVYLIINRKKTFALNKLYGELVKIDKKMYYRSTLGIQICIIGTYYLWSVFQYYSYYLGNDRTANAKQGVDIFLIAAHSVLNSVTVEIVKGMLIQLNPKSKSSLKGISTRPNSKSKNWLKGILTRSNSKSKSSLKRKASKSVFTPQSPQGMAAPIQDEEDIKEKDTIIF